MSEQLTTECPSPQSLLAVLQGDSSETSDLEAHIEHCESCQERLRAACEGQTIHQWREFAADSSSHDAERRHDIKTTVSGHHGDTDVQNELGGLLSQNSPPHIPGYLDLQQIARGGMGIVYRARDRKLKRWIALKVLPADAAIHPDRWLRFQTEAEAAARLRHPNVIQVYEAGSHDGIAYVCQELASPRSLADHLDQTPQNPRYAVEVIRQLALGIQHAHDHGVLHRDLKPANILFVDEVPKIADFGIAKLIDSPQQLTQTQAIIGTPDYMAPEQALGQAGQVGFVTDVYGLGVILYEMLTGVRPFRGETPIEIIQQVSHADPLSPRRLIGNLPRDLETICLKCLQKEGVNRYATARDLAEDLNRFLCGQPILAKPAGVVQHAWKWILRHPALASLAVVTLVSVFTLVVIWAKFTHALAVQTKIANDHAVDAENRLAAQIESNQATNEVVQFLTTDLFEAAIPENEGIGLTVLDVLDTAGGKINRRFRDQPRVEAALRAAIGNTYYETGHRDEALAHLERAVEIYEQLGDRADEELSTESQLALALCLRSLGQRQRSRLILDRLADDQDTSAELKLEVRYALLNSRDSLAPDDSQMLQLYADCASELGPKHTTTLSVLGTIASAYFHDKDYDRAIEIFREQRQQLIDTVGELHPDTVIANNNLAISLIRMNRLDEAEQLHRETCELKRACLGEEHFMTLNAYHNWAMVIWRQGRQDEATEILEQVVRDRMRVLGAQNRSTLDSLFQIGRMYQEMDRPEQGAAVFNDVIGPVWDERQTNAKWLDLAQVYGAMLLQSGDIDTASLLRDTAEEMLQTEKLANKYRQRVQKELNQLFAATTEP